MVTASDGVSRLVLELQVSSLGIFDEVKVSNF